MKDSKIWRNQTGSPAVEFAFAAPVIFLFIIGIVQLGLLFSAYAGMGSAVNEGARYATVFPTPTDAQIVARMNAKKFMIQSAYTTIATPVRATYKGVSYIELTIRYSAPLNFIFFSTPSVTLQQTRRAYVSS